MQKLNIPIASRKWHTSYYKSWQMNMTYILNYEIEMRNYFREDEMPKSVRLNISIVHIKRVEEFLKDNGLHSIRLGYWEDRSTQHWNVATKLCYIQMVPKETEPILICLSLKYGSFEDALKDFLEKPR